MSSLTPVIVVGAIAYGTWYLTRGPNSDQIQTTPVPQQTRPSPLDRRTEDGTTPIFLDVPGGTDFTHRNRDITIVSRRDEKDGKDKPLSTASQAIEGAWSGNVPLAEQKPVYSYMQPIPRNIDAVRRGKGH